MQLERLALGVALLAAVWGCHAATSPYAGETGREIKSLSPAEVEGYLAGKGMGFAKAAELNGYPGPMHVLELADELELSAEQREQSQAIYEQMRAAAQGLGKQVVEQEHALDHAFSSSGITTRQIGALTTDIAALLGRLRAVHLQAHVDQRAILTEQQTRKYVHLRGYSHKGHAR